MGLYCWLFGHDPKYRLVYDIPLGVARCKHSECVRDGFILCRVGRCQRCHTRISHEFVGATNERHEKAHGDVCSDSKGEL